eukprot:TRINITY_DN12699_c1_g1_i1.p1 TRINITY_DN12699_c1_g1~~TRINITY_DN12699_c1_g1_i1.p1  ORF type:complete len:171 (-),score=4.29 TRINITY_DN12699_c1_g1_i1:126-638(-)
MHDYFHREVTGLCATMAAMFEGRDPEELLAAAVARFRCISWDTLREHSYLIKGGGTLDGAVVGKSLYKLSQPCELSACDAFLSHSWNDNGEQKWRALEAWCTEFCELHGRAPRLWFDKVCISVRRLHLRCPCEGEARVSSVVIAFLRGCSCPSMRSCAWKQDHIRAPIQT